jgi:alpha-glucoside transport system substrate-binding protein
MFRNGLYEPVFNAYRGAIMKKRVEFLLSVVIILSIFLVSCGGAAAPTETAAVEQPTSAVEQPSETEAMTEEPTEAMTEAPGEATEAPAETAEATEAPEETEAALPQTGELRDPAEVALEAAGGEQLGGTLNILGVWAGAEADSFSAVVAPFEEATGINVELESTRDFNAVLTTRVEGGNPPDIAAAPSASTAASWAAEGKLIDLSDIVDMDQMGQDYAQTWLDLGTTEDGTLYQVFSWSALKGPIWYNPNTYDGPNPPQTWDELQAWAQQKADSGETPWCIGLESQAASGWPGTDWIEDIVLRQSGPDVYDQWWQGQIPWTSPEIKSAFETFGSIAGDPAMVYGGPTTALTLPFGNGGDALFTDPPGCYLHHQATFITDFFVQNNPDLQPVEDFNFFGFPDIDPANSGAAIVVGDSFSMYNDTPQGRAFIKYMISPEAQSIWVERGGKLGVNKRVPLDAYPDELARNAGEIIANAQIVRFDGSDLMPSAMNDAFWKAILDYVQDPGSLDSILANLDTVQQDAYTQ